MHVVDVDDVLAGAGQGVLGGGGAVEGHGARAQPHAHTHQQRGQGQGAPQASQARQPRAAGQGRQQPQQEPRQGRQDRGGLGPQVLGLGAGNELRAGGEGLQGQERQGALPGRAPEQAQPCPAIPLGVLHLQQVRPRPQPDPGGAQPQGVLAGVVDDLHPVHIKARVVVRLHAQLVGAGETHPQIAGQPQAEILLAEVGIRLVAHLAAGLQIGGAGRAGQAGVRVALGQEAGLGTGCLGIKGPAGPGPAQA